MKEKILEKIKKGREEGHCIICKGPLRPEQEGSLCVFCKTSKK